MTTPYLCQCAPEFRKQLVYLENLVHQIAAHRRKFQFACSQISQFLTILERNAKAEPMTPAQIEAYKNIMELFTEYQSLFGQNMISTWAHSALEIKCAQTGSDLCSLCASFAEYGAQLDQEASKVFDSNSPQWLQLHLLDLHAISTSFQQYLKKIPSDNPAAPLIMDKLKSIESFSNQYKSQDIAKDTHVFSPIPVYYQSWRLNFSDFSIEQESGSGISATVYYGHDKRNGQEVAIKRLKFRKLSGAKLQSFQRELAILATAVYPTLLRFVGATETPPFCIVTEWMANSTLYHDIHKNHRLDETMRSIAAYDIARGMRFLHSRQIIHRDLKTLNVLIDGNLLTRICDFGLSRVSTRGAVMTKSVGTPHWMAPELLSGEGCYDNKVDVYAFGIVLWELLTCQLPYQGLEPTQIVAQVMMKGARPPLPDDTPPNLRRLIEAAWATNPAERPSFETIVNAMATGDILLPGADRSAFLQYVQTTAADDADVYTQGPSEEAKERALEEQTGLDGFVAALEKDGPPPSVALADRCWEQLATIMKRTSADQSSQNDQSNQSNQNNDNQNDQNNDQSNQSNQNNDNQNDQNNDNQNDQSRITSRERLYGKALALLISSPAASRAAPALRGLPPGTLLTATIEMLAGMIPTGDEAIDKDLTITVCKQGRPELALTHAVHPQHIKIALEVLAKLNPRPKSGSFLPKISSSTQIGGKNEKKIGAKNEGKIEEKSEARVASTGSTGEVLSSSGSESRLCSADSEKERRKRDENDAVVDRCIQCLGYPDPMIVVAALRCLVGIGKAVEIPPQAVKAHLQSRMEPLRVAAAAALAAMAVEGVPIASDVIDAFAAKINVDPMAQVVLASGCNDFESAKYILERLKFAKPSPEATCRIVAHAAKYAELRETADQILGDFKEQKLSPDVKSALSLLRERIKNAV